MLRGTEMNIIRSGSQPSRKGPDSWFTGDVRIDAPFRPASRQKWAVRRSPLNPARVPLAHPSAGQTLIVTQGRGWLQEWGKEAQALNQGDIAWIPGVKHWHGASSETALVHIAIAEAENGSPVSWLEKVTDEPVSGRLIVAPRPAELRPPLRPAGSAVGLFRAMILSGATAGRQR
jgi:quercetin dioxygenase-like cupin family protein